MEKLFHMRWWDYSRYRFHINGRVCLLNSTLFGMASVFLCHIANPPVAKRAAELIISGAGVPLAIILLVIYVTDIVVSVRSAIQISDHLVKLQAIQAELTAKLEEIKAEQQQALEAERERMSQRKAELLQNAEQKAAEAAQSLQSKLETVKLEAQQKFRTLYERSDIFERRLLRSFPTMRPTHHPEVMERWREYIENWRKDKRKD